MTLQERINSMTRAMSVGVGAVLAVLYYFVLFNGGQREKIAVNSQRAQIEQTQQSIQQEERRYQEALQYKAQVEELGERYSILAELLPSDLNSSQLMRAISNEATAVGVNIVRVSEGRSGVRTEAYDALTVSVEFRGSFPQMLSFLAGLTRLSTVTSVSNVSIRAQSQGGGQGPVQVSFSADVLGYRVLARQNGASR